MREGVLVTGLLMLAALLANDWHPPHESSLTSALQEIVSAAECTEKLEIECAVDVERTVVACAAAFETGGADVIADIKCTRDLLADKKHCWPCICAEAKKKGWHVIGC